MNQRSKIKLFRTLKVVFYCLGLPLFFAAVVALSTTFNGKMPFAGSAGGVEMFASIRVPLNGTALYGIWIALGIWLFLAIVQVILHFTVKGRKTRMFAMVAITLVVMLIPIFVIDTVFASKIDAISKSAPDGVVVKSYQEQLSYYRTHTSDPLTPTGKKKSMTQALNNSVEDFCRIYNIKYYEIVKDGTAGNTANTPITYFSLGLDYNNDGVVSGKDKDGNLNDEWLVKIAPTGAKMKKGMAVEGTGYLKITLPNGSVFESRDFFFVPRKVNDQPTYLWYSTAKMPTVRDGAYGMASYNQNGLLSDGSIFGVDIALNILEDYYGAKAEIDRLLMKSGNKFDEYYPKLVTEALTAKADYYNSTEELQKLWAYEMSAKRVGEFSLTGAELDSLIGMLFGAIGSNDLFEFVFGILGEDLMAGLAAGMTIAELLKALEGLIGQVDLNGGIVGTILGALGLHDVKIVLKRGTTPGGDPEKKYVTLGFKGGKFGEEGLMIDFDETFTLAKIDQLLEKLIGINVGTITSILGVFGIKLSGNTANELVLNLLGSLYWYQSPVINPTFRFYYDKNETDPDVLGSNDYMLRKAFERYDQAAYEGTLHGAMVGSPLIGSLFGKVPSANFDNLTAIQQLQTDLSYQRVLFPILSVRDMLMVFVTVVILFQILSYYAAEKEFEWENGNGVSKTKKKKKNKKNKESENEDGVALQDDIVPQEDTALKVLENNVGEAK